jgi:hypothetical protein
LTFVSVPQQRYRRSSQDSEDEYSSPEPEKVHPKPSPEVKIFVAEPMRDKPVTDISGIGDILGRKLALSGFDKVNCRETRKYGETKAYVLCNCGCVCV